MGINNEKAGRSIERISLGKQIANWSDDVAYFATSETLHADTHKNAKASTKTKILKKSA